MRKPDQNKVKKYILLLHFLTSVFFTNAQNVGIGTTTPGFPLNFSNALGDKISLYGNSGNHYGFGIQSGLLQIHSDAAAANIAFGYGSSGSFTERMRILNNTGYDGMSLNGRLILKNGSADLVGGGAGVWLYKADNSALLGFMGVQNNQNLGFYGGTGGWGFTYDAINSRVGIGNSSPSYKLHIGSANNSLRIEGPASNSGTNAISVGGYGDIEIDAPGIAGGRFVIKENGNVGIGTISPSSKLSINGDIDISGTLKVGGSTGNTMQLMTSNGSANPSWTSPANIIRTEYGGSAVLELTNSTTTDLPGSTYTVTLSVPSRVILLYKSKIYKNCTIGECAAKFEFKVYLNGQSIKNYQLRVSGLLTGNGAYWTDATNGPDFFDLPAGSHTFTFSGQCVWTPPFTIEEFRVYSMIIPQ